MAEQSEVIFTCPNCGMVSHHPDDISHQYCGNCHKYVDCKGVNCPQYTYRCIAYQEPSADCPLKGGYLIKPIDMSEETREKLRRQAIEAALERQKYLKEE
ncbi:hypothetical protein LCGC14_1206510 [marine sediment metagenome]|uniref:Uncharacterized protein n=1 Tax=marine sediment metagenome TaxID=412755 RepID=A0A0F9NXJ8_9ZZZZ